MKQVDFYLISNQLDDAKFKLASRLANKLQSMRQGALLVTDDASQTARLDQLMWSFNDASFLPHETLDNSNQYCRIMLGEHDAVSPHILEQNFEVLINLSTKVPVFNHHFARIAEIVEADETAKAAARVRYKRYQTEGFELKMHQIEL